MATETINATGRRKSSIARVRLVMGGEGTIQINDRTFEDYFPNDILRSRVLRPLVLTEKLKAVSVIALANGGGVSSEAGAVSHGISRALLKLDASLRGTLKKRGLADPRFANEGT